MIDGRLPWLLVFQVLGVLAVFELLAVLLALRVGAHTAGLIGALVAVPFPAGLWEIVRELYVEPRREA
jgi:predicted PurR-regulated permease PerM